MLAIVMFTFIVEACMKAYGSSRAWIGQRRQYAILWRHWLAHPEELAAVALWALSVPALLVLHASGLLGDWTPVLIDPAVFAACWFGIVAVRSSMRAARLGPVARLDKEEPGSAWHSGQRMR